MGDTTSVRGKTLEELQWGNSFVRELQGDSDTTNSTRKVTGAFYSLVHPTAVDSPAPTVAAFSPEVAALLGLDAAESARSDFAQYFSGSRVIPRTTPFAQCYGGHQFGAWAGQLGDGRAVTLGELVNNAGERWEVQLKGAGRTPYSRQSDGRAVLRSSLREFLASEAMHALQVPTTRALSLVATGAQVPRDVNYDGRARMEAAYVVCRVAPSFLRFGTLELPAQRGGDQLALGGPLLEYLAAHHFPHHAALPTLQKGEAVLKDVVDRTAKLIACWQTVGFVHGVVNTDNMSLLGLTLDYGPFAFMEQYDPTFTPNLTDFKDDRRYTFEKQPAAAAWNLQRLAAALAALGLCDPAAGAAIAGGFDTAFNCEYDSRMAAKMGIGEKTYTPDMGRQYLDLMREYRADFTLSFRLLSRLPRPEAAPGMSDLQLLQALVPALPEEPPPDPAALIAAYGAWIRSYLQAVAAHVAGAGGARGYEERAARMDAVNPLYVPRNYLCQLAIATAETGDWARFHELYSVLMTPFTEQKGKAHWAAQAPAWAKTPGIACLS